MDVQNLIIQWTIEGNGPDVIKAQLESLGLSAEAAAAKFAQAQTTIKGSAADIEERFRLANVAASELLRTYGGISDSGQSMMRTLLTRIQSEAQILKDTQTALGRYSPAALGVAEEMRVPTPNFDLLAKSQLDQVTGESGFSQKMYEQNQETAAYIATLEQLIQAEGGVTERVLMVANAFEATTPAIQAYRREMEAMRAAWEEPIGPTASPQQLAGAKLDWLAGSGFSESVASFNAEQKALEAQLNSLIQRFTVASPVVTAYADAYKVSVPALEKFREEQALLAQGWSSPIGPTATPPQLARMDTNTVLGSGFAQDIETDLTALRSMDSELQNIVKALGATSAEAKDLAAYFDSIAVSGSSLTRVQQLEIAAFNEENAAIREQTALLQARVSAAQATVPQGPQLPPGTANYGEYQAQRASEMIGGPPSSQQLAFGKLDAIFGQGTTQSLQQNTAELAANRTAIELLSAKYGPASAEVLRFAEAVGISSEQVKGLSATTEGAGSSILGFGKGMAAGLLQLSLIGGTFVIAGRAVSEFTTGAVQQFRDLETEAQQVSTVQVGLDTSSAEASLQRLETEVPAALKDISAAYYEVSSIGGQTAQVSENLTKSIATGAAAARTDTKTWTDDVIGSMNAFHLWGDTTDQTYANATRVQAEFFQAAKDSIGTPAQLATSWGPVALAVQQAGGSMEDALALMVAASRGAGDFGQNMTTVYRLVNSLNTEKVQADLRNFGVSLIDDTGKARPVLDILQQVHDKLQGLAGPQQTSIIESLFPELRANRGAQNLINNIDQIRTEVGNLGTSQTTYNSQVSTYLDTEAAKVALLDNQYNQFRQDLGRAIDPIHLLFTMSIQGPGDQRDPVQDSSGNFDAGALLRNTLANMMGVGWQQDTTHTQTDQGIQDIQNSVSGAEAWMRHMNDEWKTDSDAINRNLGTVGTNFAELYKKVGQGTAFETPFQKWTDDVNKFNAAVQGASATFETSLRQQIGQGQVSADLGKMPQNMQQAFGSGLGAANVQLNSSTNAAIKQMADYAAQIQTLTEIVNAPESSDARKNWAAQQILQVEQLAQSYAKLHQAELDPQGESAREKAIAQLNEEYARTEALAAMSDKLAAAQQHVADVTAHWAAQMEAARDSAQSMQTALSSARDEMSTLKDEAGKALLTGPGFDTFRNTTGPNEVEAWRQRQLATISAQQTAGNNIVTSQGLSPAETAARIGAIASGAGRDADAVNQAADTMKRALASLPAGLAEEESSFQTSIDFYKQKVDELKVKLQEAQTELTNRQNQLQQGPASPQTSGLQGNFAPSAQDLQSSSPSFLTTSASDMQAMLSQAGQTSAGLAALRRMISDPLPGSGWLVQFNQLLVDARAKLRDDQAQAEETRAKFAEVSNELANEQDALNAQRNAQMRPLQDQSFALQQQQYEESVREAQTMRPLAEENYQLSLKQYNERVRENAVMRPINEALYQYNQQLSVEQDHMTAITRHYDSELIPLQTEYNKLQREQQEIQHATELENMQQSLDNQTATLARLTPGTAQYLAVRQGLVKAESDYAIKSQEYSLSDKIAEITAERDAAVQAEQQKLNAINDEIRTEQELQTQKAHGFDLEKQGLSDTSDDIQHRTQLAQHGFDIEKQGLSDEQNSVQNTTAQWQHYYDVQQRGIDDRRTQNDTDMRNYNANETKIEADDQTRINLAQVELDWATKTGAAWTGTGQAVVTALQTESQQATTSMDSVSTAYEVWKNTKLKPIQDALDKIFGDSTGAMVQDYQNAIAKITGPNGLTDQLTALGNAQVKQADVAVAQIQRQTKELQNYYTLLDYVTRYQASGGTAPFVLPPMPPGYVPPPGAPGSPDNPNPKDVQTGKYGELPPPPPPPPPPPHSPPVSPPAPTIEPTHDTSFTPFSMQSRTLPVSAPPRVPESTVPAYSPQSYGTVPTYGPTHNTSVSIVVGDIVIQGDPSDPVETGRQVTRALVNYLGTTGSNMGYGR